MDLQQKIQQLAAGFRDEVIGIRRHLHAHPELSYEEHATAEFVETKLRELGLAPVRLANTGVVALIEGKEPGSRIMALRADMDALPIEEANNVAYRSTKPGVMHACGHDVHTACLLGAAKILQATRNDWSGTVKLIFQPGEERNPGGASYMIRDGVLEHPTPQGIAALHVHPGLPVGKLSFRGGMVMASADELYITLRGKGGHAAAPHLTADTILAAAHLIVSLQQVVSRNNNPLNPTVLSITSVQGGHTTNVIPAEVKLMGTLRCFDPIWRRQAHELIRRQVEHIAASAGVDFDLHIDIGYPMVHNDEALTQRARGLAEAYLGKENVEETEIRMGAEDFGYYAERIPACFFRLGVMNAEKGIVHGVHTPLFDVDEQAIETGMGMMAWLGATLPVGG